jgi:sensor histidine kinase regulating citrate/malate metabolism
MQVFMRSFSTKGVQRGLGTYSMKILGEQYLGGKVDFETNPKNGTTFYIDLGKIESV